MVLLVIRFVLFMSMCFNTAEEKSARIDRLSFPRQQTSQDVARGRKTHHVRSYFWPNRSLHNAHRNGACHSLHRLLRCHRQNRGRRVKLTTSHPQLFCRKKNNKTQAQGGFPSTALPVDTFQCTSHQDGAQ